MSTDLPLALEQSSTRRVGAVRDLIALTKPGIVLMTLLTAGWGLGLAPHSTPWPVIIACLLGTALSVGSANAFNMWIERDSDKLMTRTHLRPLPDGRMQPPVALAFAIITGALSIFVLAAWVNVLTAFLSTFAIVVYAAAYTPMKRLSSAALPVGAIAGAMPPLLGWTAATNELSAPGLLLFGVLFAWQLPHFLAISLFRKAEYERAGIKIVPVAYGDHTARWMIVATSFAMLIVSASLAATDAVGPIYLASAVVIGVAITTLAVQGVLRPRDAGWPRRYFFATLGYLPALALGMLLDAIVR